VDGIGGGLDGPGKHGVVAIFLDDFFGVGIHAGKAFLEYEE
jgi:hypothetical protein